MLYTHTLYMYFIFLLITHFTANHSLTRYFVANRLKLLEHISIIAQILHTITSCLYRIHTNSIYSSLIIYNYKNDFNNKQLQHHNHHTIPGNIKNNHKINFNNEYPAIYNTDAQNCYHIYINNHYHQQYTTKNNNN